MSGEYDKFIWSRKTKYQQNCQKTDNEAKNYELRHTHSASTVNSAYSSKKAEKLLKYATILMRSQLKHASRANYIIYLW